MRMSWSLQPSLHAHPPAQRLDCRRHSKEMQIWYFLFISFCKKAIQSMCLNILLFFILCINLIGHQWLIYTSHIKNLFGFVCLAEPIKIQSGGVKTLISTVPTGHSAPHSVCNVLCSAHTETLRWPLQVKVRLLCRPLFWPFSFDALLRCQVQLL